MGNDKNQNHNKPGQKEPEKTSETAENKQQGVNRADNDRSKDAPAQNK